MPDTVYDLSLEDLVIALYTALDNALALAAIDVRDGKVISHDADLRPMSTTARSFAQPFSRNCADSSPTTPSILGSTVLQLLLPSFHVVSPAKNLPNAVLF